MKRDVFQNQAQWKRNLGGLARGREGLQRMNRRKQIHKNISELLYEVVNHRHGLSFAEREIRLNCLINFSFIRQT